MSGRHRMESLERKREARERLSLDTEERSYEDVAARWPCVNQERRASFDLPNLGPELLDNE